MMAPPPRPSDTDPKLVAFDDVIAKGMAKKPGKRYQTAAELAAAARRALNAPVPRRPDFRAALRRSGQDRGRSQASSKRALFVAAAAVALGRGAGGRGVAAVGRPATRRHPASEHRREFDAPPSAPDGAVAGDRGDGARRHPCDGPVGDRGQRAVRAQRVQGLVGQDRRIRRRPDERGGPHARAGAGLSRDGVREHHSARSAAATSTSGCRRSPTPSSGRSWSTS